MVLTFAFWTYVFIFTIIGAMRGWAKELLVTFSVILSLFVLEVLGRYVGPIRDFFAVPNGSPEFWARSVILGMLVYFGYQTPRISRFINEEKLRRDKFADGLLGFFLGALNGFLIVGSIWYFMHNSDYPFKDFITKPSPVPGIIAFLPPSWLGIPMIYFAIALAFLFVIVVFI